jgi:hypothetical protein
VEEVEPEVEQRSRDRLALDEAMALGQVKPPRADDQRRHVIIEAVLFAGFRIVVLDHATHGVAQVDLALDHVRPGRRAGVLEVGHERVRARVQRVDDHLALDGSGDLDDQGPEIGGRIGHATRRSERGRLREGSRVSRPRPALAAPCVLRAPRIRGEAAADLGQERKGFRVRISR